MTDEENAAADEEDQRSEDGVRKDAADKAEADRKTVEGKAAAEESMGDRKAVEDFERVITECDTLKSQVTSVTAERDAAVNERDGHKAKVERLSKLVGNTSPPPAGGGAKGKQTAEEWLKEQIAKGQEPLQVTRYRLHVTGFVLEA